MRWNTISKNWHEFKRKMNAELGKFMDVEANINLHQKRHRISGKLQNEHDMTMNEAEERIYTFKKKLHRDCHSLHR